jgi:hypothetical protein
MGMYLRQLLLLSIGSGVLWCQEIRLGAQGGSGLGVSFSSQA